MRRTEEKAAATDDNDDQHVFFHARVREGERKRERLGKTGEQESKQEREARDVFLPNLIV